MNKSMKRMKGLDPYDLENPQKLQSCGSGIHTESGRAKLFNYSLPVVGGELSTMGPCLAHICDLQPRPRALLMASM